MRSVVIECSDELDDNGEETLKSKIRKEMIQKLAAEWNETHRRMEERSWRSEEERADEDDYYAERCSDACSDAEEQALHNNPNLSEEELKVIRSEAETKFYNDLNLKLNEDATRLDVIEELLSELGARMMRPYEHWNEDEDYMEYMETRYDNDDDRY